MMRSERDDHDTSLQPNRRRQLNIASHCRTNKPSLRWERRRTAEHMSLTLRHAKHDPNQANTATVYWQTA